jgi:hypothetical protein
MDDVEDEVRTLFQKWHPEAAELRVVRFNDDSNQSAIISNSDALNRLLIDSAVLEHELNELKASAAASAKGLFGEDQGSADPSVVVRSLQEECQKNSSKQLSSLILSTELAEKIQSVAELEIEGLMSAEREKLTQIVEARLLLPFQLYITGISSIKDATLKQHLEDFVYEHFRKEVVPQTLKAVRDQKLVLDKSSQRESEKFRQAVMDAKSLSALQSSMSKFSKKMKIAPPSDEVLTTAKLRTLQQTLKSMRQMTRGSDVLQNLIWVLLAQKSEGLFMSPGKDTTRMVKQYEAVGDAQMATSLVKWKDNLKAGQETKEEMRDMREAAKAAVDEMTSLQDQSS